MISLLKCQQGTFRERRDISFATFSSCSLCCGSSGCPSSVAVINGCLTGSPAAWHLSAPVELSLESIMQVQRSNVGRVSRVEVHKYNLDFHFAGGSYQRGDNRLYQLATSGSTSVAMSQLSSLPLVVWWWKGNVRGAVVHMQSQAAASKRLTSPHRCRGGKERI